MKNFQKLCERRPEDFGDWVQYDCWLIRGRLAEAKTGEGIYSGKWRVWTIENLYCVLQCNTRIWQNVVAFMTSGCILWWVLGQVKRRLGCRGRWGLYRVWRCWGDIGKDGRSLIKQKAKISQKYLSSGLHIKTAYILRREALQGNGSSPQGFQPILGVNFSRLKLYAIKTK